VTELLFLNESSIRKLILKISSSEDRDSVSIDDVCNFVKTFNLRLTKPMVIYAFSYSKSTII
jgi:hypothetical protein